MPHPPSSPPLAPPPRWDSLAAGLGLLALAYLGLSWLPTPNWPAWPAVGLGVTSLITRARPGRPGRRALAGITAALAVAGAAAELVILWALAIGLGRG
ncbi:MAG: hypothetical protein B7733_13895 [Myxococcales bacterium FL481]|nr:MAG: hypothetical protein B7733_13895 [Myxococcales bacterium FL481]